MGSSTHWIHRRGDRPAEEPWRRGPSLVPRHVPRHWGWRRGDEHAWTCTQAAVWVTVHTGFVSRTPLVVAPVASRSAEAVKCQRQAPIRDERTRPVSSSDKIRILGRRSRTAVPFVCLRLTLPTATAPPPPRPAPLGMAPRRRTHVDLHPDCTVGDGPHGTHRADATGGGAVRFGGEAAGAGANAVPGPDALPLPDVDGWWITSASPPTFVDDGG